MSRLTQLAPAGLRRQVKLRLHRGSTYHCPFCGYDAKDLQLAGHDFPVLKERHVVGGGVRPSKCYSCGSTDRERLLYFWLTEHLRLLDAPGDLSVLHIAPEKRLSRWLRSQPLGSYVCGDLFAEGYHPPSYVQNVDVTDIPFEDDSFDLVLCSHVLEHVPQDHVAIKELARVLRPGGTAILQVPISATSATTFEDFSVVEPAERERVFGQFDHVRIYGQDYDERLRAGGFEVRRVALADTYARYGVNPDEELFVCTT